MDKNRLFEIVKNKSIKDDDIINAIFLFGNTRFKEGFDMGVKAEELKNKRIKHSFDRQTKSRSDKAINYINDVILDNQK